MSEIVLGYEIGTGERVKIPLRHTAVTGRTQDSGKTTTLEAIIHRLEKYSAVAFITKRGEGSFRLQRPIPPYFREPELDAETPMWRWVESIFGTLGESVGGDDQALIIQCSEGVLQAEKYKQKGETRVRLVDSGEPVTTLEHVADNVALMLQHARGRDKKSLTRLNAYFKIVMPQIRRMRGSARLDLARGLNVMDIADLSLEMQMLVIRGVLEEVYTRYTRTVVVIPEAWKFIPLRRSSPVRFAADNFIRQALALKNVLMLDSQDLANIATETLKSIGVWILGVQGEINEVKRVVDYIPAIPKIPREEIMQLGRGEFYCVAEGRVRKVYVQPAGMDDAHAIAIARGDERADSWTQIVRTLDKAAPPPPQLVQTLEQEAPEDGDGEDGARSVQRPENRPVVADAGAIDRGPQDADVRRGMGANRRSESADETEEETVWKEKYEAAQAEIADLKDDIRRLNDRIAVLGAGKQGESYREPARSQGAGTETIPLGNGNFADFLRQLQAHPKAIALLREQPEIRVEIERPVLAMRGDTPIGRVAVLIHDKFFSEPRDASAVLKEFKRRGWIREKAGYAELIKPMKEITAMGFLTIEQEGYQGVPGMKISTKEAQ